MNLKRMKQVGWLFVIVAVMCSFTLWGQRLQSEADYKNVQLAVNYNDIVALANANQMTTEAVADELKKRGVSTILFKEWSIGDLANLGQVSLQFGDNIKTANFYNNVNSEMPVNEATLYIGVFDKTFAEQIRDNILQKVVGAQYYD